MTFKAYKLINDPVYGFINIPNGVIYEVISHPYFQRLRRIKQMGFSEYVYPGAVHTRFQHAIGAFHLTTQALNVLESKGVSINEDEKVATCLAILLHDVGHGPFSHSLERMFLPVSHETISLDVMEHLTKKYGDIMILARKIFTGKYPRAFLHQLVSSQLDMDRMDYLMRDSYFTGVSEGIIGYRRIIQMLNVSNDELVVEEKGLHSVENFLMARGLMYWEVYLHKTSLSAEKMLKSLITRLGNVYGNMEKYQEANTIYKLLGNRKINNRDDYLDNFMDIDDYDVIGLLKSFRHHKDRVLSFLSTSLLKRKLFTLMLQDSEYSGDHIENIRHRVCKSYGFSKSESSYIIFTGQESNVEYQLRDNEIMVLMKNEDVVPLSQFSFRYQRNDVKNKHFLGYPHI